MSLSLIVQKVVDGVTEATLPFHPLVGIFKGLWKLLSAPPEPEAVLVPPAPQPAASPSLSLVPIGSHAKLDVAERERLFTLFEKHYPGAVLTPESTPALQYLQCIQQQCQQKAWAWLPWRRILSDAALLDLQGRKLSSTCKDFVELVAEAAGLCSEEWDGDLSGSPHRVYQLLCTRAHAYALCSGGHLHNWLSYANRFLSFLHHYSRRAASGWRGPSPQEAEDADREVLGEVFRQVHRDGLSLDDALSSVVREDYFRHYLSPRPRLLSEPDAPKKRKLPAPLGSKPTAAPNKKGKAGECCRRPHCKFLHACAICKDPGHSSKACAKPS